MRKGSKRLVAAIGGAVVLAGCLSALSVGASATSLTTVTFVASWSSPNVLAIPITTAIEKGFYQAAGINLDVTLPPTNSTDEDLVGLGKDDLGASTVVTTMDAIQAGLPIITIANESNENNYGLFWNPGQKVDAQTYEGGGVGAYTTSFSNAMLVFYAKYFHVTANKVKIVFVTNTDIPILVDHKIDFATSTTNFGAVDYKQTTKHAADQLLATQVGAPNTPIWTYIGNTKWLASHKSLTTAFLNATLRGTQWAMAHPTTAVSLYSKYFHGTTGYSTAHNIAEWEATSAVLQSKQGFFVGQASEWSALATALKGIGSLKTVFPADKYFTNVYIGNH